MPHSSNSNHGLEPICLSTGRKRIREHRPDRPLQSPHNKAGGDALGGRGILYSNPSWKPPGPSFHPHPDRRPRRHSPNPRIPINPIGGGGSLGGPLAVPTQLPRTHRQPRTKSVS